ncbi:MAG: HAD hydrolase family protein [Wujia sp.]
MQKKKLKIPGIGARIVKSALAVALCMIVNVVRGDEGIVFYSQLAALWCIQMYRNNTVKNALQRTTGTIVGAVYGLIYILIFPYMNSNIYSYVWLEAVVVFISIIVVIYTTVLINKRQASYFSCVVFLSIIINHIGDSNPYSFVWNRFLDTMIGICIGVLINNIRICFNQDRETLFVSGVDDILVDENNRISAFSKVELNRMIDDGMRFTISTKRTPASLLEPLSDISFRYPVIVMDGAALYDVSKNEYVKEYVISPETAKELNNLIHDSGLSPYINVIIDDTLLIYYQDIEDKVNCSLLEKLKASPYRNYIKREFPGDENVVYFMVLNQTDIIDSFYDKLINEGYDRRFKILKYASDEYRGYSYIKIYNKNASKENMLLYLKEKYQIQNVITFGTVPNKYDIFVNDGSFNEMVRLVRQKYEPIFGKSKCKKVG